MKFFTSSISIAAVLLRASAAHADPLALQASPAPTQSDPGIIDGIMSAAQQVIDGLLGLVFHSTGGFVKLGFILILAYAIYAGVRYLLWMVEEGKRKARIAARKAEAVERLAAQKKKDEQSIDIAAKVLPLLIEMHGHTIASRTSLRPDGNGGVTWKGVQVNTPDATTIMKEKKASK